MLLFPDEQTLSAIAIIAAYEENRLDVRYRNRKAMRLLRGLLSDRQREQLRRRHYSFTATGSDGGEYRLWPYWGTIERLERHGKYLISVETFCYHDPEGELPPADLSIAHMLLLSVDEGAFLKAANRTARIHQGWNGEWHQQLRAARQRRDELAAMMIAAVA